ncbi:transglutaminase-like domain-containing protein [Gilvimarinus polysaccharolyticus]|uniref:transglutaminase-like domain-containing protein n=1 Tax=Gilvimarinus polysaccharolyticus TaxID=863921 RepID=UPI0018DDCFCF|nr:transglutaminase-like domain-containing protein [Gilvimarinus polysaccharolyticus]
MSQFVSAPDKALIDRALSGAELDILQQIPAQRIAPDELLAITPQMAHFAEQAVSAARNDADRVQALHDALLLPESGGGRGIQYEASATYTPAQAYRLQRANCLSFSLLFVAMARHIGLEAHINDVAIPPTWDRIDDRLQFMRHVNVKVKLRHNIDTLVIDLDMRNYRAYYSQQTISDRTAKSQFYNNLAIAPTNPQSDTLDSRFYNLKQALALDDRQSFLWNNLATLYRQQGLHELSEALYAEALTRNPQDLTAIRNLSQHYRYTGRLVLAEQLDALAYKYRESNPYYQYRLASQYYRNAEYQLAAEKIEIAIKKHPGEQLFYKLAVDIYETMGLTRKLQKAQRASEVL